MLSIPFVNSIVSTSLLVIGFGFLLFALLRPERTKKLVLKELAGEIRPVGELTPKVLLSEPITEDQKRTLAVYNDMLESDRGRLISLVSVVNSYQLLHELNPVNGGRIDFGFTVNNCSILTVSIGYQVGGALGLQGLKLHEDAKPQKPQKLYHGERGQVTITQPLLPEVCKQIREGAKQPNGIDLRFNFQSLFISLESETPLGHPGPTGLLSIPAMQKYRVKQDGPVEGFYSWELMEATNWDGSPWK